MQICEKCNKNEATIFVEEIVNEVKKTFKICNVCAKADFTNINLDQMLKSFLTNFKSEKEKDIACNNCGITYKEFKKTARLGCSACYEAFSDELIAIFKNIQSATTHSGSIPKKNSEAISKIQKIEDLRAKLKAAVLDENYEEAAKLRDAIKELEENE